MAAILDSQSVKSDPHGGAVGHDAGKQIKGRKRHLLVDTLGLLLGVHVTPASTPERAGAQALLARVLPWFAAYSHSASLGRRTSQPAHRPSSSGVNRCYSQAQ